MKNKEGIEIYVHIPFCERKCDYCDFVSFVCPVVKQDMYFDALIKQIELVSDTTGRLPVVSCFFGGGTPSSVNPEHIVRILKNLMEKYDFDSSAEISIEANPNSVTKEKLSLYKEAGFNRLSLGLQSTNNAELALASRLHTYEEFLRAYELAKEAGFTNINIDLMSALPTQTLASYEGSLRRVIALNPKHISAYSLILEEGTPFYERYKDGHDLPDEDTEREMYYLTKKLLKEAGYERYEISNYALPGYECLHNTGYWERRDYLGFGLAASSLYKNERFTVHGDLDKYIEGNFDAERSVLTKKDVMEEFMFLGLRLVKGISKQEFRSSFSKDIYEVYGEVIEKLKEEGLLWENDRIGLTDKGLDLANYAMSQFLLD